MSAASWFTETLYETHAQRFEIQNVIYRSQTDQQDLIIFENRQFGRVLALDGIVQTTEHDEFIYHEMLTHTPILAHGAVERVLIIGGGDGGMLRESLIHPVRHVTLVEIDRQVIDLCTTYLPSIGAGSFDDARAHVVIADGARFVAETDDRFDVIIVDSTDPIGPGEALFTEQFYADCKASLTDRGIIVTQNGTPALQPEELNRTMRYLARHFTHVTAYLGVIPSYYGGSMAFGFATDDAENLTVSEDELTRRVAKLEREFRYYSPGVHRAAFVLPPYLGKILASA